MKNRSEKEKLEQKLTNIIARTSIEYGVLAPDDKIAVALSGGKDSYGLLHLLSILTKRLPFSVDLVAVHIDQGQPGFDNSPLRAWLAESGIPFEIISQNTYEVVQRNIEKGQTACSVCARLRRGILYTFAKKRGCNKLALGHHREDTLATLMMNMFYCGKMQAMPAKYRTDDDELDVIRPMIEIPEKSLIELAALNQFPIIPCSLCSGQKDHKRLKANALLDELEIEHPRLKQVMLGALKNIRPSHLLDKNLKRSNVVDDQSAENKTEGGGDVDR